MIEIQDKDFGTKARFNLEQGGRLVLLELDKKTIISDVPNIPYEDSYAGAWLFPWSNRVLDGEFIHLGRKWSLPINEIENRNAHHGLIYNTKFKVESQSNKSVTLFYSYGGNTPGFPWPFSVRIKCELAGNTFTVNFEAINTGSTPFPCNVGWHPYFLSNNLEKSQLHLNSDRHFKSSDRGHVSGWEAPGPSTINFDKHPWDDSFSLSKPSLRFVTPEYIVELTQDCNNPHYLQIYTPPKTNSVAIEPTTGIANSLNSGEGINILDPGELFDVTWSVALEMKNLM